MSVPTDAVSSIPDKSAQCSEIVAQLNDKQTCMHLVEEVHLLGEKVIIEHSRKHSVDTNFVLVLANTGGGEVMSTFNSCLPKGWQTVAVVLGGN